MKKVFCIIALGLLVAQICARPDGKDKAKDKGKDAAKGAEDKGKGAAKGAEDKAKPAGDAKKGADDDAKKDSHPPAKGHKHKSIFSIPIEIGEKIVETGLGFVKNFEDDLPF